MYVLFLDSPFLTKNFNGQHFKERMRKTKQNKNRLFRYFQITLNIEKMFVHGVLPKEEKKKKKDFAFFNKSGYTALVFGVR